MSSTECFVFNAKGEYGVLNHMVCQAKSAAPCKRREATNTAYASRKQKEGKQGEEA